MTLSNENEASDTNDVCNVQEQQQRTGPNLMATWQQVTTKNNDSVTSRAYHTATLLSSRYLLIVGGMMFRESIMNPCILDTHTWSWIPVTTSTPTQPSGRHGHSMELDEKRNRIVLFGGGSGTSLLRSGTDNSEVWELQMGDNWESDLEASFPWTWKKLHEDSSDIANDPEGPLSPAESLVLGRCHSCLKVAPETVLFLFGSGRPSTNMILGYNLESDQFVRPNVSGPIPRARFTGVATCLESEGYAFYHGGYSPDLGDAIGDMGVLDLAPTLHRNFNGLPINTEMRSSATVNDDMVIEHSRRPDEDMMMSRALQTLLHTTGEERQERAAEMLRDLPDGSIGNQHGHMIMILHMIASGQVVHFAGEGDDSDDESVSYTHLTLPTKA